MPIYQKKANEKINKKYPFLNIKTFSMWTGEAILIDDCFGEFYCKKLSNVFHGQKTHPERAKINAKILSEKTCMDNYGVKNPMLCSEIKEKFNNIIK